MNVLSLGFFSLFMTLLFEVTECKSAQKNTSDALNELFGCLDNSLSNNFHNKCDENIAYGVNVAIVHRSLTSPIWETDMNPQILFTSSRDFELFYEREVSRIISLSEGELLLSGHPNEIESNNCLIALNNNCAINRKCLEEETESENTGYSLTHQIIYWQNFRQMECSKEYDGLIKNIIKEKCRRVYAQQVYITRRYNLDSNTFDLFTEQVAVCGMEGFEEFLNEENRKIIINNQMTCGCYKFIGDSSNAKELQSSCRYDAHLTSVAALALTVHLKYEIIF
ncbi:uncharacterized protein LOC111055933 isoform X2 [Nilaparvata lugens]|uniref:uncharacterized protein LOC111055933 isoform X2 n=1 Tax=Nilaparvata lugens TaxID=108931 RepID=UPI00193C9EAA|nr:uncharacterized protein LOC111055933 isoform X2 [Nilaparvata lugens]